MSDQTLGVALSVDPHGRLTLMLPSGESFADVTPVRCFPFSAPTGFIAFCDERGREVYCLDDPASLPAKARAVLERELARREFIPEIQRIEEISPASEPSTWRVVTDRGPTTFVLPSEDGIRRHGTDAAIVADDTGVRYRIGEMRKLDEKSRRFLRRYL